MKNKQIIKISKNYNKGLKKLKVSYPIKTIKKRIKIEEYNEKEDKKERKECAELIEKAKLENIEKTEKIRQYERKNRIFRIPNRQANGEWDGYSVSSIKYCSGCIKMIRTLLQYEFIEHDYCPTGVICPQCGSELELNKKIFEDILNFYS